MPRGSPTASVQANTRLSAALYAAVTNAAQRAGLPIARWIEAAIQEKLEREGLGREDTRPGGDDGP
jgi:predicted HicB family RNase H-like nuclease